MMQNSPSICINTKVLAIKASGPSVRWASIRMLQGLCYGRFVLVETCYATRVLFPSSEVLVKS